MIGTPISSNLYLLKRTIQGTPREKFTTRGFAIDPTKVDCQKTEMGFGPNLGETL